jgi:hypothetical protein
MSLNRWISVILMLGLILVLSPLGAQAEPYQSYERPYYHHPHGNAYGWDGPRHRDFDRHREYFRDSCRGPHHPRPYVNQVYAAPPPVAYVAPVAPIIGYQACPQPQPFYSQPAAPGVHGQLNFGF